jgi:hypothetical protein
MRAVAENVFEKCAGGIRADETAVLDAGGKKRAPLN